MISNALKSPPLFVLLALLTLAAAGALVLIYDPGALQLSDRERSAYGSWPAWRAACDAVSAACGVGVLLFDVDEQYTTRGRWVLAALSGAGAAVCAAGALAALAHAARSANGARNRWTNILLATAVITAVVAAAAGDGLTRGGEGAAWASLSFAVGAGLAVAAPEAPWVSTGAALAAVAAALLIAWRSAALARGPGRASRRSATVATVAATAMALGWFAAAGALLYAFESPRAAGRSDRWASAPGEAARARVGSTDWIEWSTRTATTAHSGSRIAGAGPGDIHEGSKLVVALTLLAGGLAPGLTGGVSWLFIALALSTRSPVARAARGVVAATLALWLVTALGLLVIDSRVGDAFEPPASLGDALLESACAVGGGAWSPGIAERLTSGRLSRAMGQPVDSYYYGMSWLVAAMTVGRVLPIAVLAMTPTRNPQKAVE